MTDQTGHHEPEIADARHTLKKKTSTRSSEDRIAHHDALHLRLNLPDDGDLGDLAQEAVFLANHAELDTRLLEAFWATSGAESGGLDASTAQRAVDQADDAGKVHLRSLESLTAAGCVTSTASLLILAELRVLRTDQARYHAESLTLQRQQVELLQRLTESKAVA